MRKITSLLMLCLVCIGLSAQKYPINYDVNATKGDRHVNSVTLQSPAFGKQTIDVSATRGKVYNDYTSQSFEVVAGETVTPTIGYDGSWMHGYVYIDLNQDNALNSNEELVSYTFYSATSGTYGANSAGQTVKNDCNANNPPAFTAPATPGTYYIRFKVDWNSIDPAGCNDSGNTITANRGSVIDVQLVVKEASAAPLVEEGKFYTLECRSGSAHSTERFIADNGTVISGQAAEGTTFSFESAGDGGYYMKSTVSNKYLSYTATEGIHTTDGKVTSWVLAAPAHTPGVVTLTVGDDKYLNNNGSDCTNGSTTSLKANTHVGGPTAGNACSLWELKEVVVFVPALTNGVYEFKNVDATASRGYLVHSTAYEGQIKLAESKYPGLTSTDYAFASRTESGVNPYWYVYNSEKGNTYIFSLANGQFMYDKNGDAVELRSTPQAVVIEENEGIFKIKSTVREAYVTAAVGWGQNAINVRWNNEYNDGGHPYNAIEVAQEVDADMLNTALAAIDALENGPAPEPEPEPVFVTDLNDLSNNKVYTILNARNGSGILYHPSASDVISWNGRIGYNDIEYSTETANYQWAIYKSAKGKFYLYNIAAAKFAGTTETGNASIPLVSTVTNSYEIAKRSNVADYPFMLCQATAPHIFNTSFDFATGLINWNGGYSDVNDKGNAFAFCEAGEIDATVLSTIEAAVAAYENAIPALPYTPITETSELANDKVYVIIPQDNGRGYFYANATSPYLTSTVKAGVDKDVTSKDQQFAIVSHNGKSYLYSLGADKFVHDAGGSFAEMSAVPASSVTLTKEASGYFSIKLNGTECINISNGYDHAGVLNWNELDAGNQFEVAAVNDEVFDPSTVLVMIQNYEGALTAEGILASYDGVGYPADSERELLAAAAANSKADCKSTENLAALATAAASYKSTSNVKMPEDGKAYTFTNVQKDGTKFYFACDATTGVYMSENEADACTFVCKVVGDKYVFVNNNGQYLAVKGSSAGTNGNKGFTEAYDQTEGKFFNDFTITKLTPSNVATAGNTDAIAVTDELLFGYVGLATQRADRDELIYFVIKNNKGFDQANAPFCRHNLTSMVKVTEVEFPNKPIVNDAQGIENVYALSTFCAPFATVAPSNVEVYIAAKDESHYIKLEKVEGAVPANTGVVLVSTDDAQVGQAVAMVPATTETLANVEGNLLRGDAAKADYTVDAAVNAYVLGAVDSVVGFYPLSATDRTIKQGKAYLVLDETLSAVKLYFGGDDVTGIETVEKAEKSNAPIFDLSGRRVVNVAKGGIYIQNGKKFFVK